MYQPSFYPVIYALLEPVGGVMFVFFFTSYVCLFNIYETNSPGENKHKKL